MKRYAWLLSLFLFAALPGCGGGAPIADDIEAGEDAAETDLSDAEMEAEQELQ